MEIALMTLSYFALWRHHSWAPWLVPAWVAAPMAYFLYLTVYPARRRHQLRRLLAVLTREEQREILASLTHDPCVDAEEIVKPLLHTTRGGSPSPAAPPEAHGDEPSVA